MGVELVEEVMDYAPASLKPMEWKGLIVLARDANDRTRVVFHGVNDPEILHRIGVSKSRWDNIRGGLLAAGVLEYVRRADGTQIRGNAGGAAKFRIPDLKQHPAARKPAENRQPSSKGAGNQHPSRDECLPESASHSSEMGAGNQQKRVPETGTPTPPYSSGGPSSLPQQRSGEQTEGREGGEPAPHENRSEAFLALAAILKKEPRLTLGVTEIEACEEMVACWLERSTAQHLELALTRGLPAEVTHPLGLIRKRLLGKLPPAPAATRPGAELRQCAECNQKRPVAGDYGGRPYCATCMETCSKCDGRLPESLTLDGLCRPCREE